MDEFKLSASVKAHDDDVRAVCFPRPDLVISASRDASVRVWKTSEPDTTISSTGQAFMTSVAFLPPSDDFPNGLVVSGSQDAIIDLREPGKPPDSNAERMLIGHSHNVCALDVSPDGKWIVSGSWDQTAKIWEVGKWTGEITLEGHKGSVWSVLAYSEKTIITACADHMIRVFSNVGKLIHEFEGSKDVVRALCKLNKQNGLGADFASAGNDGVVRLWNMKGTHVAQLLGHESFIYSLASLPNGDIVSSGEDRTVRIWRQTNCIQTITLPAISVWCVAVNPESSDIVSGASDRTVRVFTREEKRVADADTLAAFDEAVKGSSIPQQQVGEINKEKLPGPDFLKTKIGTKEGQVVMIREDNGNVTAHTWSSGAQEWVNVGTVVDSAGSSGNKQEYMGKDYDYVFDVDIEEGKPPLKLPYNASQNPYEAATKFIEDNELSMNYLDEVANFITTNTRGTTLGQGPSPGQQTAPAGSDPWGTESRYRPGDADEAGRAEPARPKKVLPQKEYLSITTANIKMVVKKIVEFNDQLLETGPKEACLNPAQVQSIQDLGAALEKGPDAVNSADPQASAAIVGAIQTWPPERRIPLLDMLRLLTAAAPALATPDLLEALEHSGSLSDSERPNNQMLACRALANLFQTPAGVQLASQGFARIHALVRPLATAPPANRNITISVATLYINYAALLAGAGMAEDPAAAAERALLLEEDLCGVLRREKDSEGTYRCLVALGTLLSIGPEVREAAGLFGIEAALARAASGVREPRIRNVIAEIRQILG